MRIRFVSKWGIVVIYNVHGIGICDHGVVDAVLVAKVNKFDDSNRN